MDQHFIVIVERALKIIANELEQRWGIRHRPLSRILCDKIKIYFSMGGGRQKKNDFDKRTHQIIATNSNDQFLLAFFSQLWVSITHGLPNVIFLPLSAPHSGS